MTHAVRTLLCVGALTTLLACESSSLPSLTVPSSAFLLGTGRDDLWWLEEVPGSSPQRADRFLVQSADGGERRFLLDDELREVRAVAPGEPGTFWVVSSPEPTRLVVRKLDPSGLVLTDRSEDFELLSLGQSYGSAARADSHAGAVALTLWTSAGQRHFRFDGAKFAPLTPPAALGSLSPLAVRGLDDLWFSGEQTLVHYRAGAWTELRGVSANRFLSFDEAGVGWSLGGLNYEVGEPGSPTVPRTMVVPILRVENDEAQVLRLDATALHASGFVLSGVVARPGGKFALLGHIRHVTRESSEVSVRARGGDASGLSKTDTVLHRCTTCISSSLMNLLDDGSFLIEAGAISPGRKLVLIGEQRILP